MFWCSSSSNTSGIPSESVSISPHVLNSLVLHLRGTTRFIATRCALRLRSAREQRKEKRSKIPTGTAAEPSPPHNKSTEQRRLWRGAASLPRCESLRCCYTCSVVGHGPSNFDLERCYASNFHRIKATPRRLLAYPLANRQDPVQNRVSNRRSLKQGYWRRNQPLLKPAVWPGRQTAPSSPRRPLQPRRHRHRHRRFSPPPPSSRPSSPPPHPCRRR